MYYEVKNAYKYGLIYLGIFTGIFDVLGIETEGKEIECVLTGGDKCTFKLDFVGIELDDSLVDEDISDKAVEDFLSSL